MRFAHLQLLLVGVAAAATIAGCGAPGQFHSNLPPTPANSARSAGAAVTRSTGAVDGDAALADAVTAAHRDIIGSAPYGVYNGHFVPAQPAPGRPG